MSELKDKLDQMEKEWEAAKKASQSEKKLLTVDDLHKACLKQLMAPKYV